MERNLQILANWWAEQVFSPNQNWDNGENSEEGFIALFLGNTLAFQARSKAPIDAKEKFKESFV